MKNISLAMKQHLAGEVTTLACCWRAKLKNGTLLGFTDHSRDIYLDDAEVVNSIIPGKLVYRASTGFTPSAVENSSVLNVDNLEVEAILTSDTIYEADLMAGRWDAALIDIFLVNWEDPSMGRISLKSGILGQITLKQSSFTAEIRGLTQAYTSTIGESYTPHCRAKLGDERCKVNLSQFTVTGTVSGTGTDNATIYDSGRTEAGPSAGVAITGISRAIRAVVTAPGHTFANGDEVYISDVQGMVQAGAMDNNGVSQVGSYNSINGISYTIADVVAGVSFSIPVDTRLGSADSTAGPAYALQYTPYIGGGVATLATNTGYFDFGLVTFTSGLNQGLTAEVKMSYPGALLLQLPLPFPIAVGDTYTAVAGCAGRLIHDCKEKFNNVLNFRGEPYIPGLDRLMIVGTGPDSAGITYTSNSTSNTAL